MKSDHLKKTTLSLLAVALCVASFSSCDTLRALAGTPAYDNMSVLSTSEALVGRQYRVQLIECIGNASAQDVTAILAVTNIGPNARAYIGGSSDGTLAVDNYGVTSKPYASVGKNYDLPSGVTVRVEVTRINPVRPGTPLFQTLRINIGNGQNNIADFRNVPIVWTN